MPHISNSGPITPAALQRLLAQAFSGALISVRDDTHLHEHHNAMMHHNGGHYRVKIIWAGFAKLSRVERQRTVQKAVQSTWDAGHIHALTLTLLTPEEAAAKA